MLQAVNDTLPLTNSQMAMWLQWKYAPDDPAYNNPLLFELDGDIDVERLKDAFAAVADAHPAIRMRFIERAGVPLQYGASHSHGPLEFIDLSDVEPAARAPRIDAAIGACLLEPFDLLTEPVYRFVLVRTRPRGYLLALNIHHICVDGASALILLEDISSAYADPAAYAAASAARTGEGFGDVLEVERRRWADGVHAQAETAWRAHLADRVCSVEFGKLAFDGERAAGGGAGQYRWTLPDTLPAKIKAVNRLTRTTPFVILMSAFGVLLHRYLQQDALAIAYPVDTRPAGFARIFGSFINFVPAFVDVSPDLTAGALFDKVREQRRRTKAIADFPQVDLMRLARRTLADAALPCLNVALVPARFALDSLRFDGVRVEQRHCFTGAAKQDLALLYDGDETLSLILEYRHGLLDEAIARRMAGDLNVIVERIVERPDLRLGDLTLSDHRAFAERYATLADAAPRTPALAAIERGWREQPERIVAGEPGNAVSARQLLDASNRVARRLAAANVKPGERVGVRMDRGGALLAALVGIWKLGAVYVPLPTDLPGARRAHIADDAQLAACLHRAEPADPTPRDLVLADDIFDASDAEALADFAVDPDSVAYLIYTSGSTGAPKGVEVTHRNVASFLLAMARALPMGRDDRLLATTTIGFDISLLELLLPPTVGAAVIACPEHVRIDAKALERVIADERVTWLQGTPSFFNVLRAGGWRGDKRLNILCGGEPIDASTYGFLRETCAAVWQVYGPTEATIWSTIAGPDADGVEGLGEPLRNTTIHLLDAHGQQVPRFSKGEICIGGHGVARGYRHRAALSAERFVHVAGAGRVYRTGDFAFRDAHDRLRFLGREDGQVKIRGFRVELGEIERQIEALGGVRKAVVLVRRATAAEPTLIAWCEPHAGRALDADALRAALADALPAYMTPARIEPIDAWPLNANGKIDRGALAGRASAPQAPPLEPRDSVDPLVPTLQAIYADVLRLDTVDPRATLMSLGGHSLSAVRIIARIQQQLKVDVGLETFMANSSVIGLIGSLRASGVPADGGSGGAVAPGGDERSSPPEAAHAASRTSDTARRPATAEGATPAPESNAASGCAPHVSPRTLQPSASEKALYFLDSVSAVRQTYNIPVGLHFPEGVNADALERALRHVLDTHGALRAAFEPSADGLVKRMVPTPAGALIARHAPTDFATLVPTLNRMLLEPFELHEGPLMRAHHFPLEDGGAAVFYLFHHIIVDGIGCGNFLRELAGAYEALVGGMEPGGDGASSGDGNDNGNDNSDGDGDGDRQTNAAARVDELIERFGIVDRVLNLPYRAPFPEVRTLAGDSLPLEISAGLRAELDEYSRAAGVPLATLLLSAFVLTLHRLSGDRTINVGLATMNRTPETLGKIGLYTNTIVLPVDIEPADRLGDFVDRVTAALFSIYGYADVPFEEVAGRLVEYASLGRTPVFQAFFNFIDRSMYAFSMAGLPVREIALRPTGSKFELSLEVNDFRTHTQVFFEYSKDVFDEALVGDIASEFARSLLACVRSPGDAVERFALTTQS
ncbi:non-ribosomal peptide synthetase [Burkholderia pseudomallei]|uniref:non-ribosomal peptide synthetase n=1 Tax=Burkholderia pseudomallei TaxID=28450 RepID=UPI000F06D49B|nr:non-ribosomal peptide synthetase [Burkholderia pseudomallei]VBU71155.1 non-ribosomal peptide/polyketide synthase [Burkholderia pseudomallei]